MLILMKSYASFKMNFAFSILSKKIFVKSKFTKIFFFSDFAWKQWDNSPYFSTIEDCLRMVSYWRKDLPVWGASAVILCTKIIRSSSLQFRHWTFPSYLWKSDWHLFWAAQDPCSLQKIKSEEKIPMKEMEFLIIWSFHTWIITN